MADTKTCPKCSGSMTQGRILKFNEYTVGAKYMYVFAPDDESGPDLSKMFSESLCQNRAKLWLLFVANNVDLQNSMGWRLDEALKDWNAYVLLPQRPEHRIPNPISILLGKVPLHVETVFGISV